MSSSHLFFITTTLRISILLTSLCFLLPSSTTARNASETDRLALLSFKSLIRDDPYGALLSWNTSIPHCQWQGVVCGHRHHDRVTKLSLDSFQLVGQISPSLGNLTFLQNLSLSNNGLYGNIPEELGELSRLRFLNLSVNSLHGSIPYAMGNNCSNLSYLLLRNNNIGGTIPMTLEQCQNLRVLSLRNNFLTGGIPLGFGKLSQLKSLRLSNNNFTGIIPPNIGNLTNLNTFDLAGNSLIGSIPTSLGQLQSLIGIQISDNQLSGMVPHSLYNLTNLVGFDLNMNYLQGFLPPNMCDVFQTVEILDIFQNQFGGQIPSSMSNCTSLKTFDISYNNFIGTIPSSIGSSQGLDALQVSYNQLEAKTPVDWSFVPALINCTNLHVLDARNNQLQGPIPSSFANISSLNILALGLSPISGSIPSEFEMLTNLTVLDLEQTLLTGEIPKEIGNLWNLEVLILAESMLSGEIPSTLGNLTKMSQLYLKNNKLEGRIPSSLGNMQSLLILDVSNNKLTGEFPKEILSIHSLSLEVFLSHNHLNGSIPSEIGEWNNIVQIDLSYNSLSSQIPSTIDGCQLLQILYLEDNSLYGPIPSSLNNLKGLQDLDLSHNSFSGNIPPFIGAMELKRLNISFNDFQGELPQGGIFSNITAIDVRGNSKLCGGVPGISLPKCISNIPTHKHHSQKIKIVLVCIGSALLCISVTTCFFVGYYWRRRSKKNLQATIAITSDYKRVSYSDIFRATNSFSLMNVIGSGSFGVVYKATMSFGSANTVAVKVLNLEQHGAIKSFLAECEALKSVQHRNLIKILSVCSSIDNQGNDFKALIFEFMPNGSLETWLYPNASEDPPIRSLTLIQRVNIAIDVAMALEYLHDNKLVPIVHCDLKPSNVLLDDGMTAHVGDLGLARFFVQSEAMHSQSTTSTLGIKGTIGYIPPEYGTGGQASTQGDVYSYGILLLEMFTGISPTDKRFKDGLNLHTLVEMAFPTQLMDIIDAKAKLFLLDEGEENRIVPEKSLDCLVSVIQCGLLCCKESARERIAMNDVVNMLNSTRANLVA